MKEPEKSLQDTFGPNTSCFGCGPKNEKGLRIKSFVSGEHCVADWTPESHHEAFPGMINGGIIGALLDCHSNWTAAWTLMNHNKLDQPPCTVTANFNVKLLKPTPSNKSLHLEAKCVEIKGTNKATIFAELSVDGEITATCEGLFVAVKEGHPAYHRWH